MSQLDVSLFPHSPHVVCIGIRSLISARILSFMPCTIGFEITSLIARTKVSLKFTPHVWSPYASVPSHNAPSSVITLPAKMEPLAKVRVI